MNRKTSAPARALAERAHKGRDIQSGAALAHALGTRRHPSAAPSSGDAAAASDPDCLRPPTREELIAEAAYFRSAHRGFEPGQEVDDWLSAESQIDAAIACGDLPVGGVVAP